MKEINEERISLGERELKILKKEVRYFNLLQKNVTDMELADAGVKRMNTKEIDPYDIPEDQLVV